MQELVAMLEWATAWAAKTPAACAATALQNIPVTSRGDRVRMLTKVGSHHNPFLLRQTGSTAGSSASGCLQECLLPAGVGCPVQIG